MADDVYAQSSNIFRRQAAKSYVYPALLMEQLWAGTRYNMSVLNDSSPCLQLNNVSVNASQHVRVLGAHLHQI